MYLKDLYNESRHYLHSRSIHSSDLEAWLLLSHAEIIESREELYRSPNKIINEDEIIMLKELIQRRVNHEPMAYILGEKEFYSRAFHVNRDVLIPRPETELLVDRALWVTKDFQCPSVVDVGTGSGCVAVTIALENPTSTVIATDISEPAINVAKENACLHGVENRMLFVLGDVMAQFTDNTFDIVVSNPPYVSEEEYKGLEPDLRDYEPKSALVAGETGLECIEQVISVAGSKLRSGGFCLLEIGESQADSTRSLMSRAGYSDIYVLKDYSGNDRVVIGRWTK